MSFSFGPAGVKKRPAYDGHAQCPSCKEPTPARTGETRKQAHARHLSNHPMCRERKKS